MYEFSVRNETTIWFHYAPGVEITNRLFHYLGAVYVCLYGTFLNILNILNRLQIIFMLVCTNFFEHLQHFESTFTLAPTPFMKNIYGSSPNYGEFKLWTTGSVTHRSASGPIGHRPLANWSPRPGDTRQHYEASNDITDDVMINQWNSKLTTIYLFGLVEIIFHTICFICNTGKNVGNKCDSIRRIDCFFISYNITQIPGKLQKTHTLAVFVCCVAALAYDALNKIKSKIIENK